MISSKKPGRISRRDDDQMTGGKLYQTPRLFESLRAPPIPEIGF